MNIYQKLNKVQEELKCPKDQRNSFGGYNYRSCEDILEAVKPLLFKNGLALTMRDEIIAQDGRYYIKAIGNLVSTDELPEGKSEKDREYIIATAFAREAEQKKGMDESQVTGTASSYARKYMLNGLFGIDDTKDADTDEYTKQTKVESKPTTTQPKTTYNNNSPKKISEAQAKRLFAIGGGDIDMLRIVCNKYGYQNSKDILEKDYERIVNEVELRAKGVEVNDN
jgi:hypothetical protein